MCEYSSDIGDVDGVCFGDKIRRARKDRTCDDCGGTIAAGDSYRRLAGKTEGDVWTIALCVPCNVLRDEFAKAHGGEQPVLGELDDALEYCVREETSWDDDDNEVLSEAGQRWRKALDEMTARRAAAVGRDQ